MHLINPPFNNSFDSTIAWMNTPHVPSLISITSIHFFSWNIAIISQPHPVIMMTKMEMKTRDLTQEKIWMIGELFPNCVTESIERVVRSIDFDALRQELSDHIVEGPKERYQFTWPGPKQNCLPTHPRR